MDYMTMNFNRNGGSGTSDYSQLTNKPSINDVTLSGNKTSADLGLMPEYEVDTTPTESSENLITSGGVWTADKNINDKLQGSKSVSSTSGTIEIPDYGMTESIDMYFKPTQDLHGHDKPWAGGAGKNKFDVSYYNTTNFSLSDNTLTNIRVDAGRERVSLWVRPMIQGTPQPTVRNFDISEKGTYSGTFDITQENVDAIRLIHNGQTSDLIIEDMPWTTTGTYTISFEIEGNNPSVVGGFAIKNIQIEQGSTATSYEPYSNICPISGQDNATLTDEYDNKYIASLGGTYYGGRVFFENSFYNQFWEYIASYNGETLPREWISDRDEYIAGTTPTIGAEVAYRLDTTIGHRISVTREPLSRGEITYNGSALYISYQKDNVIGECKKFTVDEIAKLGLPQPPTIDGTYRLECSVSSGTPTITWVLNS